MDPIIGGLISAGGSLLSNIFGSNSAQKQMDFQKEMYGSRYQMQMADMQKAGLNPMLSYMQSPGSAPGGTSFTPSNVGAAAMEGYQSASNSATTNAMRTSQVANMVADTGLKEANAAAAKASAVASMASARNNSANAAYTEKEMALGGGQWARNSKSASEADIAHSDTYRARNEAEFYSSPAGKIAQNIGLWWKNAVGGPVNSAASVARMAK